VPSSRKSSLAARRKPLGVRRSLIAAAWKLLHITRGRMYPTDAGNRRTIGATCENNALITADHIGVNEFVSAMWDTALHREQIVCKLCLVTIQASRV